MMTRIHAYVLIADPSFLKESLAAYYPYVDRIVLSYDRTSTSWTGTRLPVKQCLRIVAELDRDRKCVHEPGDFARLDHTPLENDTFQRQAALDAASVDADWVLQLDTDEVMPDPQTFFEMLENADRMGAAAMDYPSRWLYSRTRPGRYLETSSRFWRRISGYPGPLAVKAYTKLRHARQADVETFRVDIRARSTDPARPKDSPVHAVVPWRAAVLHFSWVREPIAMRRKFGWSGHTAVYRPPEVHRQWTWRTRHPVLAALGAPLSRPSGARFRMSSIAEPPGGEPPEVELDGESTSGSI